MNPVRAAALALVACAVLGCEREAAKRPRAEAKAPVTVGCIGTTVASLDASIAFYRDVLEFRPEPVVAGDDGALSLLEHGSRSSFRRARLSLGNECVELTEYPGTTPRPVPPDSRSNDRWFQHVAIVVSDLDAAFARLEAQHAARASVSPQTLPAWNPNAAGISAYYFHDPDFHTLEIIRFPAGKGDERWQSKSGLFLGIDHTAIVVEHTDASRAFYEGTLGLHIAGGSDNHGPEQEKLNAVPGAHLRITTFRGAGGPGVELLEYLAPRDGRPYPGDEAATDLVHWRTVMHAPALDGVVSALASRHVPLASGRVVTVGQGGQGLAVRDPDGHLVELVAP